VKAGEKDNELRRVRSAEPQKQTLNTRSATMARRFFRTHPEVSEARVNKIAVGKKHEEWRKVYQAMMLLKNRAMSSKKGLP
jgi:hypothetical protein